MFYKSDVCFISYYDLCYVILKFVPVKGHKVPIYSKVTAFRHSEGVFPVCLLKNFVIVAKSGK